MIVIVIQPEHHSENIMQAKMRRFNKKKKNIEHLNQRVSTMFVATKFIERTSIELNSPKYRFYIDSFRVQLHIFLTVIITFVIRIYQEL